MSTFKGSAAVNRIAVAKEAFQKAIADESKQAMKDLSKSLEDVVAIYSAMKATTIDDKKSLADDAWSEPVIEQKLKLLGLVVKPEKAASTPKGERVDGELLEKTILEICKTKSTAAEIMAHASMVALYQTVGKPVSSQAIKLQKMVEEKKLVKTGERKKAAYQTK